MRKNGRAGGLFCIGSLLLIPAILLTAFLSVAQNGRLYAALQRRLDVNAGGITGVSDEDMLRLDESLAAYLRGERAELDEMATVFGEERIAFGDDARLHMVDVYGLFELARRVRWISLIAGGLLLAACAARAGRAWAGRLWRGWQIALAIWAIALTGFAAWAASDFNRAFIAFHHALFRNGLWLMDWQTELMIRMLPERFFMSMAALSLAAMALALALTTLIVWAAARITNRRCEE